VHDGKTWGAWIRRALERKGQPKIRQYHEERSGKQKKLNCGKERLSIEANMPNDKKMGGEKEWNVSIGSKKTGG